MEADRPSHANRLPRTVPPAYCVCPSGHKLQARNAVTGELYDLTGMLCPLCVDKTDGMTRLVAQLIKQRHPTVLLRGGG